jgi:hypothetical protein
MQKYVASTTLQYPKLAGIGTAGDLVLSDGLTARFRLLDARPFTSGVVVLSYELS